MGVRTTDKSDKGFGQNKVLDQKSLNFRRTSRTGGGTNPPQPVGYQIQRSLRFNSPDSAYLSRTPASAGNRKTWTWAGWVKRSALTSQQTAWSAGSTGTNRSNVLFQGGGEIRFFNYAGSVDVDFVTTPVYRDASAWYHLVISVDTTQATSTNRFSLYVNGVQVTVFSTATYPSLNQDLVINSAIAHGIGRGEQSGGEYFSGYLADIYFIDGQALTPSSFTEVSATTGRLEPKAYSGPTPTGNSFWLPFSDNSAATATTLGKDNFNLGNNWTPNNLSVTAGVGNDSLVDVPTNGSEVDAALGGQVRGNYCTWNPLSYRVVPTAALSNGNLDHSFLTANYQSSNHIPKTIGTFGSPSGKWYWEILLTGTSVAAVVSAGITLDITSSYKRSFDEEGYPGFTAKEYAWKVNSSQIANNSVYSSFSIGAANGDTLMVAVDMDAGKLWFGKNGSWVGDPAAGTGEAFSGLVGTAAPIAGGGTASVGYNVNYSANFGQRAFAYTAPSGFKALNTANLPAPLVTKPSDVMDVKLWTGNGSSQTISGLGFSPDLVWIKARSQGTDWHALFNTIVGATTRLFSNSTAAEATNAQTLSAFTSDGFSLGNTNEVNGSSMTYVGWCWDAGNTTVTNTQGSISSQVRANASAGFSVVTWTGDGAASRTVGHGLGIAPKLYLVKRRNGTSNFVAFTTNLIASTIPGFLNLNSTSAIGAASQPVPTSSVLNIESIFDNISTATYVAYCFAPVAGYSAFGSYTGNGSADGDGPFVYTGFRPRWVMIKCSSAGSTSWQIVDAARPGYNVIDLRLRADTSESESSLTNSFNNVDFLSNGFKIRGSVGSDTNTNGATYIYATMAEAPFQYARAR
jgi:hypothetical protein